MDNGKYRAVFHSPLLAADSFRAAHDEMRGWLRTKGYDLSAFDDGDPRVAGHAMLLHSSGNAPDGTQTQRWQLNENRDHGTWRTTLTVHVRVGASTGQVSPRLYFLDETPVRIVVGYLGRHLPTTKT
jgi:hypothetical protein